MDKVKALAAVALGLAGCRFAGTATSDHLEPYRWKNRLLLVCAPLPNDARFIALEYEISAGEAGALDRDLLVLRLFASGPSRAGERALSQSEADAIRRRFSVGPSDFAVILVGKDGGEKKRWNGFVEMREVFALIDTMPMRKKEIEKAQEEKKKVLEESGMQTPHG